MYMATGSYSYLGLYQPGTRGYLVPILCATVDTFGQTLFPKCSHLDDALLSLAQEGIGVAQERKATRTGNKIRRGAPSYLRSVCLPIVCFILPRDSRLVTRRMISTSTVPSRAFAKSCQPHHHMRRHFDS